MSLAAERSPADQRRRPAARFRQTPSPLSFRKTTQDSDGSQHGGEDHQSQDDDEGSVDADEDQNRDDDEDEDGQDVRSPLLPIFSAEHLGLGESNSRPFLLD